MSKIILNAENIESPLFKPSVFKYTSKNGFDNYFFAPNMSIKLYSPKVSWVDNNSISFGFEKTDNENLLNLVKNINDILIKSLLHYMDSRGHLLFKENPCIYYEKPDSNFFYIKCNLPNTNGRFFINCTNDTGDTVRFIKPRVGYTYNNVVLDIRNIWKTISIPNKIGFRLELKDASVHSSDK